MRRNVPEASPRRSTATPVTAALLVAVVAFGCTDTSGSADTSSLAADVPPSVATDEPRPPPSAGTGPWTLVFSDEFDNPQLDRRNWATAEPWAASGLVADDVYFPGDGGDSVVVDDGRLLLRAELDSRTVNGDAASVQSGMITTRGRFDFEYGYVEARMRLPGGAGLWPAFWLLGNGTGANGWPRTGEIDIAEFVNNGTDDQVPFFSLHWWSEPAQAHSMWSEDLAVVDTAAEEFHTYGLLRTEDRMTLLVDGAVRQTVHPGAPGDVENVPVDPIFTAPMHLRLTLSAGGPWATNPNQPGEGGALEVDWVRAYEFIDAG